MIRSRNPARRKHASGIALIVALIALVGITLAALALVRSVSTGLEISGNMAFKEASIAVGDLGTETAVKWLKDNFDKLDVDGAVGKGYYASYGYACDLTGNQTPTDTSDDMVWNATTGSANCNEVGAQVASANSYSQTNVPSGYKVYFVINRMCNKEGKPDVDSTVTCNPYPDASGGLEKSTKGGGSYSNLPLSGGVIPYYRITAKIVGPRNTVSYTQALVTLT